MSGGQPARATAPPSARGRFLRGVLVGALLFAALVVILLFAGELSSSRFLYVDF